MTPKEKAQELMDKMQIVHHVKLGGKNSKSKGLPVSMYNSQVKQCALNCIDEIEKYRSQLEEEYDEDFYHAYGVEEYWEQVRIELEQL